MNNVALQFNIQPQARVERLLTRELKDETLIYDLETGRVFCLNETAASVWAQCDGQKNISEIITALKTEKKLDSNEELIRLALHELNKQNLLVKTEELNQVTSQINRREVIKRLAIGTAFMLPVISFIMAPTAVFAQSCSQPICSPTNLQQPCCSTTEPGKIGLCLDVGGPTGQIVAQCLVVCGAPPCTQATLTQPCCGVKGNPQAFGLCVDLGAPVNQILPVCIQIGNP